MKDKPYIISGKGQHDIKSCVLKINYNNRYVVVKCKVMMDGLKRIENGLNGFIRGGVNNPTGIYYHLYNHVKRQPDHKFDVEVVIASDNAYELLKEEQKLLDAGRKSKKCLNNNTQAYIPQYDEGTGMYGWIDRGSYMNFKKWYKTRKRKPTA